MTISVRTAALRSRLVFLCVAFASVSAAGSLNAQVTAEDALTLLESHLPPKTPAERADCQQLAVAVRASAAERPKAAYAVVSMALSVPGKRLPRWLRRSRRDFACGCVTKIVQAALNSAPGQGSRILEAAVMLFPDCAEDLTAMLKQVETRYASLGATDGNDGTVMSDPMMGTDADNDGGYDYFTGGTGATFLGGSGAGGSGGGSAAGTLPPNPSLPPVTADTNG